MDLTKDLYSKHIDILRRTRPFLKLVPLFLWMIALGAALARYSDSPLLIIMFLGALTLLSFIALDYALYILVGFLPFSFRFIMMSGTEMQIPTEPLLAAMGLALVLRWLVFGRGDIHVKFPFWLPLLMYAGSLCLSMINTGHRYSVAKGSLRAMAYMMLAIVVFHVVTDKRRLKWLFVMAIVPASVAAGWTAIFLASRLHIWRWSRAYEGLPFTSYAHYGAFVGVILLLLLARSLFDRGKYDRVIWTILLGYFAVAMCFSFSRGAWISLIAAAGFMILQKSAGSQHKKLLLIGGSVALFMFLLLLPPVSGMLMSRISTITSFGYGANRVRLLRWATALAMFRRRPIIGCGYGSFARTFVNDPTLQGAYVSQFAMGAHNKYLQILAETGLVGFIAWMWIIISFFLYGFRLVSRCSTEELNAQHPASNLPLYRSLAIGIMAAELSLLVHFLVNSMIQADVVGVPFWLLIGLLPALGNLVEKERRLTVG